MESNPVSATPRVAVERTATGSSHRPLCVDLDGTLVATNLLFEACLAAFRQRPLVVLWLPFWLARGKAYLWSRVGPHAAVDVTTVPYRREVLQFIRNEHDKGRPLTLVTGSHETLARRLAGHLGIFRHVLATCDGLHLVSEEKARVLVEHYGERNFDYIGDSRNDIAVWEHCATAYTVKTSRRITGALTSRSVVWQHIPPDESTKSRFRVLVAALRCHQWAKNLLVFVPMLLAHHWTDAQGFVGALFTFIALCLASSSMYLTNDLLDLETDRHHSEKRKRPIAAGHLSIPSAAITTCCLLVLAFSVASMASVQVAVLILGYICLTLSYSLWLKRVLVLDVVLLAGLYCYRVLVGGAATEISISPWTIAFSLFIFVSLAFMKRYAELERQAPTREIASGRRGYRQEDKTQIGQLGISSGMLSILVIALYVNGPEIGSIYRSPRVLWFICPIVLLWIGRLWIITGRGEMNEDPVLFALRDRWSIGLGIASLVVVLIAATF